MGLQEAKNEKATVDAKLAELGRYHNERLRLLQQDDSFGAAESLLKTTGASSAATATEGQINEALTVAEANPAAFESHKKILGVLKELKEAQQERIGLQKESAQAALAQANAERAYLASLRNVLSVMERIQAASDSDSQVFDLRRQQATNRVNARRVNTAIPLSDQEAEAQSRAFDDELSNEMIAVYEEEIAARRVRIAEFVATANVLDQAQREVANSLLGGVDITRAGIHRLNDALALLNDDEARGKPVDADVRAALEAQISSIGLEAENAADEGAIIGEQQSIVDREQANLHKITERQVRDAQQNLADTVRSMMRSFQDMIQQMDDEVFSLDQEFARASTEGNVLKARNKLMETITNLDSPFIALFDTLAGALQEMQDVTLETEGRMREGMKLSLIHI